MVDARLKGFVTTTIDFMDMKIDGNDLSRTYGIHPYFVFFRVFVGTCKGSHR